MINVKKNKNHGDSKIEPQLDQPPIYESVPARKLAFNR